MGVAKSAPRLLVMEDALRELPVATTSHQRAPISIRTYHFGLGILFKYQSANFLCGGISVSMRSTHFLLQRD
jgi:hypothetical protein